MEDPDACKRTDVRLARPGEDHGCELDVVMCLGFEGLVGDLSEERR